MKQPFTPNKINSEMMQQMTAIVRVVTINPGTLDCSVFVVASDHGPCPELRNASLPSVIDIGGGIFPELTSLQSGSARRSRLQYICLI